MFALVFNDQPISLNVSLIIALNSWKQYFHRKESEEVKNFSHWFKIKFLLNCLFTVVAHLKHTHTQIIVLHLADTDTVYTMTLPETLDQ